jgi:hypothetical protein
MNIRITFLSFCLMLLSSCSFDFLDSKKKLDTRLIGVWYGSETGQEIKDVEKKWEITRLDDGSYTIQFALYQFGKLRKSEESGTWWTENGKYYENHDASGHTDIYKYEVMDNKHIKFVAEKMSSSMYTETYEFIDIKKTKSDHK